MGVNTTAYKVRSFVVAAFFAGLAGAVFAHYQSIVNPGSFTFVKSMEIVVMIVAGGLGSTTGAILAAMLVFAVMKWWSILGGLVLWLIAVGVLARMAKVDPLLRHVYIRHIRYRDFYPAKSRISAPPTTTPANWR